MTPNGKIPNSKYTIALDLGTITFEAIGFRQHNTDIPKILDGQQYDRK
jgi:hypothetical protein